MMKRQVTRQGMRTSDLLRTGCVNLWRRKTRTILTAVSMTIGVMCIVVLISVGLGYGQSYQETVEAMGSLTKIDVSAAQKMDDKQKTALLNDKAVESIRKLDGVEAVTPVEQLTGYLKSGSYIGMIKLYGIDLSTAESFQLTPVEGEAPTEGLRLHPEVMVSDDLAASFGDPNNNWADAVDEDGNPLVDVMNSPIKLTFDYDQLNGNQKSDKEGRATTTGTFYNLDVSGICSSQNNTYSTSGFLDITRLQEWKKVQADQAAQKSSDSSSSSNSTSTGSGSTDTNTNNNSTTGNTTSGTNTNSTNTNSTDTSANTGNTTNTGTTNNSSNSTSGTQTSAGSAQGGGTSSSATNKDTERAAVNSSTSGSSSNSRSNGTNAATSDTYDLVWVKAEKVSDVQRISNLIKQAGFETYSLNDMLETVKKQSRQIQGVLGAIGLVSLLVAGIGVANTMMMSINERTREVGILKVLGTEFSDIAKLFLTEAFLLGLAGGITGLILSLLMGQIIPRMFADMDIRCVFTWWLILGSVLFAGVVALIAAWIPARKAMNISPNEAIRSE